MTKRTDPKLSEIEEYRSEARRLGLRRALTSAASQSRRWRLPEQLRSGAEETAASSRPSMQQSEGVRRAPNRILGYFLVISVLTLPILLGGNRPVAWLIATALFCCAGAGYLIWIMLRDPARPLRSARLVAITIPAAVFIAYVVVQTLPIASFLPETLLSLPDTGADSPSTISLAPRASMLAVLRLVGTLVFFILMVEVAGKLDRARRMAWLLFFGVVAHALWGIVALQFLGDVHFWGEKLHGQGSVTGTFINRNSFATFLGMGAVLGLALIIERMRSPRMRQSLGARLISRDGLTDMLLWTCLALVMLALLGTHSRMGLAATLAGMLIVILVSPPAEKPSRRGVQLRWDLIGLGALLVLGLIFSTGVIERSLFAAVDLQTRLELYRQTLAMIAQRPLTGFGVDAFAPAFELHHQAPLSSSVTWEYAHSTYLTLWSEAGLIFGSLPLVAGALVLLHLGRLLYRRRYDVALPVAALASVALAAIHSTVDFSLEMQGNVLLLLAIVALGISRRAPSGPPVADNQGTRPSGAETQGPAK
jgi:O-antigen ligase